MAGWRFRTSCVALAGCAWALVGCGRADGQATPAAEQYDLSGRPVELIPPGTVIGDAAPEGWTHLVIKSQPRLSPEDAQKVSRTTAEMAELLSTGFLANVTAERSDGETSYRLDKVAVGLGTRIKGRDTIVSPDTQKKLGAGLGFTARLVLSEVYAKQQQGRVAVRSHSIAVIDTTAILIRNGRHRESVLRYVVLVDAGSGQLESLVWPIDLDDEGAYLGVSGSIDWLPPDKFEDAVLQVDPEEFTLGLPSGVAFAIGRVPQGQLRIKFPSDFAPLAGQARFEPDEAERLERRLREILHKAAKVQEAAR